MKSQRTNCTFVFFSAHKSQYEKTKRAIFCKGSQKKQIGYSNQIRLCLAIML